MVALLVLVKESHWVERLVVVTEIEWVQKLGAWEGELVGFELGNFVGCSVGT